MLFGEQSNININTYAAVWKCDPNSKYLVMNKLIRMINNERIWTVRMGIKGVNYHSGLKGRKNKLVIGGAILKNSINALPTVAP